MSFPVSEQLLHLAVGILLWEFWTFARLHTLEYGQSG